MSTARSTPRSRRSRPPVWLVEGLDMIEQRRILLIAVVSAIVVVGSLLALLAPGIVPPVPVVGAALGFAAILLGLAVVVASDTADLIVRGPRHVSAAGGELVAVLPDTPDPAGAVELAEAVLEAKEDSRPLLLGLAAAGRDTGRSSGWTDALAVALVDEDVSVLSVDLASGRSEAPGLVEVIRDGVKLAQAVEFQPGLRLARLAAGSDQAEALTALGDLPSRLPRDLDVLLVALPTAASRQVVEAAAALDHVLIVAERDRTSRVDLIAGLDALESAGTHAQVVLLDDRTAERLGGSEPEEQSTSSTLLASVQPSGTVSMLPPTPAAKGSPDSDAAVSTAGTAVSTAGTAVSAPRMHPTPRRRWRHNRGSWLTPRRNRLFRLVRWMS